ncbi:MAG: DUF3616 domain-containing protein [Pseudomonadota bacterium]
MKACRAFCTTIFSLMITVTPSLSEEPVAILPAGETLFSEYDPDAKADTNVSGASCFGEGHCILVADEMVAVQQIHLDPDESQPTFKTGPTYGLLFDEHCTDLGKRKHCEEVDLEAIARQDRTFYMTGSMGNRSRSGKRAKDRWFLARFGITKTGEPKSESLVVQSSRPILKQLYAGHEDLAPYLELPLQCGGVNVEGFAVIADQMFFGLRSPADLKSGGAFVVQTPESVLSAKRKSDVPETILHRLTFRQSDGKPIKGVGIRALEALGERLLIATGDAGVSAPSSKSRREDIESRCAVVPGGPALPFIKAGKPMVPRIWIWDPNSNRDPIEIARLGGPYTDEKLEGIALLDAPTDNTSVIDLLLTIDGQNDVEALALLKGIKIPD